jgi:hypothetical protein
VVRRVLYPNITEPPTFCQSPAVVKFTEHLSEDAEVVTTNPPNYISSLLHWIILAAILDTLTSSQCQQVQDFWPTLPTSTVLQESIGTPSSSGLQMASASKRSAPKGMTSSACNLDIHKKIVQSPVGGRHNMSIPRFLP